MILGWMIGLGFVAFIFGRTNGFICLLDFGTCLITGVISAGGSCSLDTWSGLVAGIVSVDIYKFILPTDLTVAPTRRMPKHNTRNNKIAARLNIKKK